MVWQAAVAVERRSSAGCGGPRSISNPFVFWIALAIPPGSLAFLGHNWSPAKVFMGDVGSTFLGYSFAVLPLSFRLRAGTCCCSEPS